MEDCQEFVDKETRNEKEGLRSDECATSPQNLKAPPPTLAEMEKKHKDKIAEMEKNHMAKIAEMEKQQKQNNEMNKNHMAKMEAKIAEMEKQQKQNNEMNKNQMDKMAEMEKQLDNRLPTLRSLKKQKLDIPNEAASTPHTDTKHKSAVHSIMDIPHVNFDMILDARVVRERKTSHDSELTVAHSVDWLMNQVVHAMNFGDVIETQFSVPMMDTEPDIVLKMIRNKIMAGEVEVKKDYNTPHQKHAIFGSQTEVAGEVFEQLFLQKANLLGENSVGILTTYNSWQLVSMEKLNAETDLEWKASTEFFNATTNTTKETAPDRPTIKVTKPDVIKGIALDSKFEVQCTPKPGPSPETFSAQARNDFRAQLSNGTKEYSSTKGYKYGRVAELINETSAERSYFASKVVRLGDEKENEEVLKLIAVYVLLVLKGVRAYIANDKDIQKMQRFCARTIAPNEFALKEIQLTETIKFHSHFAFKPNARFYSLKQLGYGSSGVCCLSINTHGVACVLKFLHQNDMEAADAEALHWRNINGLSSGVLQVNEQRVIVVVPYLRIPSKYDERYKLAEKKKESPLYRALAAFCNKGYTHSEVFWHHIGTLPSDPETCYLCDLGGDGIKRHNFTQEQKEEWVQNQFNTLMQRIGTPSEGGEVDLPCPAGKGK